MSDTVSKIPSNNKRWVTIKADNDLFVITSNVDRAKYLLYKQTENGYEKIGTGNDPSKLETEFIWKNRYKKKE